MITAILFDMDGVLVDNEKLKGLSVGMAVQRLRGLAEPDPQGIQAYLTGILGPKCWLPCATSSGATP